MAQHFSSNARHLRARSSLPVIAMMLMLSACGGSGGSSPVGSSPSSFVGLGLPVISAPATFETAEYAASTGLDRIGASSAYAVGGTGDGITVGVIDTGIDTTHSEFAGAIDPNSININTSGTGAIGDASGHGTLVAGVIGARRNGASTHGVAFDSSLLAIRAEIAGSCTPSCAFDQNVLASATNYAVANGADVINYSLGGAGALASSLRNAMAAAVDQDRVLVIAAGNEGSANPTYPGRFAGEAQADGAAIVVGSVDGANTISSFSNRAGVSANYYLVAPGESIRSTNAGGGTAFASGTSLAAPFVSGAAAVVRDAAPFLSAAEVVQLLLSTATDLGAAGTDTIYGRGLLNLDAAMAPQGDPVVPTGSAAGAGGALLSSTSLVLDPAFGDALHDLGQAIYLDSYGRAYRFDADDLIASSSRELNLADWFEPSAAQSMQSQIGENMAFSLRAEVTEDRPYSIIDNDTTEANDLAFALTTDLGQTSELQLRLDDGVPAPIANHGDRSLTRNLHGDGLWSSGRWLDLTYRQALGDGLDIATGMAVQTPQLVDQAGQAANRDQASAQTIHSTLRQTVGRGEMALQLGHVIEEDQTLGSQSDGALAFGDQTNSSFVRIAGELQLNAQYSLSASAMLSRSAIDNAAGSLITGMGPVVTSGFDVTLTGDELAFEGDRLSLRISQPQRVESGDANIRLPVARTFGGEIIYDDGRHSLEPSGREIDIEAAYGLPLTDALDVGGNLLLRTAPGHDASATADLIGTMQFRFKFN